MNIAQASLHHSGCYLIDSDEGSFVVLPGNTRQYIALQEWIANGGVVEILPSDPTPVPEVVSRFQALAALHSAGYLNAIEAFMLDEETDTITRLAWANAQEFRRNSPTIAAVSAALGISDTELDQLFITASQIEA